MAHIKKDKNIKSDRGLSRLDVFEALAKRRTCRSFSLDPIPKEIVEKLIYAARRAPTGGNANTRRYIVIDDINKLEKIKRISPGFIGLSPLLIAICTDTRVDQSEFISIFDAGAAAENIALAATALGLGVGFVKSFPEGPVKKILGIPNEIRLDILVTIGKKKGSGEQPNPRSPFQAVYHNTYGVEMKI